MRFLILTLFAYPLVLFGQSIETVIQKGHELAVLAVAISPDSNYVATGSRDKSAKLWQLSTGREVRSFLGHQASVTNVKFSRNGKHLITTSHDRSVKIWEVLSGKERLSIKPDEGSAYFNRYGDIELINDVVIDPQEKFMATVGQMVYVWEYATGKKINEWQVAQGNRGAEEIAISPNGEWLTTGTDGTVEVYSVGTWKQVFTIKPLSFDFCGGCRVQIDFSPDSRYLIKATSKEIARYDVNDGKLVTLYSKEAEDIKSVSVSPDGKLISVIEKNRVSVYDFQNGDLQKTIDPGIEAELNSVTFTTGGKQLLIACDNNVVLIYDVATGKKKGELTGLLNQREKGGLAYDPNSYWDSNIAKYVRFKNNLLLSRDNKTLLKGKFGDKIKRWNIASGKTEMEYVGHQKAALCYQYSRDGKRLLTGGGDGTIILWNAEKGDTIFTIKSYQHPIFDVHFNSDETQILSSSWDGYLKIHDVDKGKRLHLFELKEGSAYHSQFSRNGLYVFTATLNESLERLHMREIDTQKIVRSFDGHTDVVSSMLVSQDGKRLLTTSWDGSIRQWDVATGLAELKLIGHTGAVLAALYSNAEKNLFSAGADGIIRLWDMATGKVIKSFEGHVAEITSLQLTSDEKMLISHSIDGSTKFWDLTTGKEFFEHIHLGEKDWMVKDTKGYFSGTQGARKFIHFVDGLKTYSADQFFDEFYRPDLLPSIFQKRGADDNRKGIQGKIEKSPPPAVKVAAVHSSESGKADVFIKIVDNGAGVDQFKLFHNGKSVSVDHAVLKLPKGKDQFTTYRHSVSLVGGNNTFSAVASNKDKVESDPNSVDLFSDHTGKTSTCYLLAVGINSYKNPRMSLNYAKPDAESFEKIINQNGNALYKNLEVHTLFDEQATRSAILAKLDELATKIQQEDVFIFYYAGHGSMVDDRFFFIPSESLRLYDLSSLQRDAIEGITLQDKLKNILALKQLIVMDACQSGGSVELLAMRGAAEEKAIAQLSRSAGIHVMASAGSEQFATEFKELGHGLFTYLLIKGLEGEADGAPKDGKVTIYELKSYIDDQVPEMTRKLKGKPQYPYTFSRGQDFPVVVEK
jgi:WD40 repeat protein